MDSNWLAILTYKYNNNSQLSYLQLSVYMKTKVNKVKHRALSACRVLQDPLRTTWLIETNQHTTCCCQALHTSTVYVLQR